MEGVWTECEPLLRWLRRDDSIVKVKPGAAVPERLTAGRFDEHWPLPQ